MSEIAKCPICGDNPQWFPIVGWESGWKTDALMCCGYGSTSVKGWNQYAAAMELAQATNDWYRNKGTHGHVVEAQNRVMEFFK